MADETPTPVERADRTLADFIPWYFVTRFVGVAILVFGVFADHTPERGTIILAGAGLLGIDKVARSEPK
jgi:hypothetical protein